MVRTETFKTPLYGVEWNLILYNNPNEGYEWLEEKYPGQIHASLENWDGCVSKYESDLNLFLCVRELDGVHYPTPGIIAHEAKHLTNHIFDIVGVDLDLYNDEPECYLLGWIVNRIHETL